MSQSVTGRNWIQLDRVPYKVKFDVDNRSGLIVGMLIAPNDEENPDKNHIHAVYNVERRTVSNHVTIGEVHLSLDVANEVADEVKAEYPEYFVS